MLSRTLLVRLAFICADAAHQRAINEEDAGEIYGTYLEASGVDYEKNNPSVRVNTSKLRQVIRCAEDYRDWRSLFERVERQHKQASCTQGGTTSGLYDTIVSVARSYNKLGREPSERAIDKLVRSK